MFGRKRRPVEKEPGRISPFLLRRKPPGASEAYQLSQLRVVLVGERGGGKSRAGNTLLGRAAFGVGGGGTQRSLRARGVVQGREVSVVDTPGWGGPGDAEAVRREIRRSLSLCPSGPHAVLLAVPAGWGLYPETRLRDAQEHLGLLGDGVWRHTILLFTRAEHAPCARLQLERRGRDLQRLAEACGGRSHALSGRDGQVTQLLEMIERMVVANDGWHYKPPAPLLMEGEGPLRLQLEEREREVEEKKRKVEEEEREEKEVSSRYEQKAWKQEEQQKEREQALKLIFEEQLKIREQELKLISEEQLKIREQELKLIFEEQLKIREQELKLISEKQLKIREQELKLIFEEQQRIREQELKLISEGQLNIREQALKLIFEEQQRIKEQELKLTFKEQLKIREQELKLIFEEQQRIRELELKLTFEEQRCIQEQQLKVKFAECRRGEEVLREEWRTGGEELRLKRTETVEREREGASPARGSGEDTMSKCMGLDGSAESLPAGGAAVPVSLGLRLEQDGQAKTRSCAAGNTFPRETQTWCSSSDWFQCAGLAHVEGGEARVEPLSGEGEGGRRPPVQQGSSRADLGSSRGGGVINVGGEDLQLAAGMHGHRGQALSNRGQALCNGKVCDGACDRDLELPGEKVQRGGRVRRGQTDSHTEKEERGREEEEEEEEEEEGEQGWVETERGDCGGEIQDEWREREEEEEEEEERSAGTPYLYPVVLVLGAVVGAAAGAVKGAVGGAGAGAVLGGAVAAQLMAVLGRAGHGGETGRAPSG